MSLQAPEKGLVLVSFFVLFCTGFLLFRVWEKETRRIAATIAADLIAFNDLRRG